METNSSAHQEGVNLSILPNILLFTNDPVLAVDLSDALANVGFSGQRSLTGSDGCRAVIVDADGLTENAAGILRDHVRARVPIAVIADSVNEVQPLDACPVAWFPKPVLSDEIVEWLRNLLNGAQGPEHCELENGRCVAHGLNCRLPHQRQDANLLAS